MGTRRNAFARFAQHHQMSLRDASPMWAELSQDERAQWAEGGPAATPVDTPAREPQEPLTIPTVDDVQAEGTAPEDVLLSQVRQAEGATAEEDRTFGKAPAGLQEPVAFAFDLVFRLIGVAVGPQYAKIWELQPVESRRLARGYLAWLRSLPTKQRNFLTKLTRDVMPTLSFGAVVVETIGSRVRIMGQAKAELRRRMAAEQQRTPPPGVITRPTSGAVPMNGAGPVQQPRTGGDPLSGFSEIMPDNAA